MLGYPPPLLRVQLRRPGILLTLSISQPRMLAPLAPVSTHHLQLTPRFSQELPPAALHCLSLR